MILDLLLILVLLGVALILCGAATHDRRPTTRTRPPLALVREEHDE